MNTNDEMQAIKLEQENILMQDTQSEGCRKIGVEECPLGRKID